MTGESRAPRGISSESIAIESILEVMEHFLYAQSLDELLEKIVKTVSDTFGLRRSHIGIKNEETGFVDIRAIYGYEPERLTELRKIKWTMEEMMAEFKPELKIGSDAYYVPSETTELRDEDMIWVSRPERLDNARRFPDEWHERDYVDFLMHRKDGTFLGYLEIDEPENNKVPDEQTIKAIEIFSNLAAVAIQSAEVQSKLKEDKKKISLLLDLIGHDVNNYVQAVNGFVELGMARPGVPEPTRKSLGKALDQLWNLNRLVTDVKIYARIDEAEGKELKPIDLTMLVKDSFKAVESSAGIRTVSLNFRPDDKPKYSDMNDLAKEVFVNIFSNAIKFDRNDKVEIEVDIEPVTDEKRSMWVVSVADHGPGVEDDQKNRIFDRFAQAGTRIGKGSGLGLHIARTLVDQYKGRIWVEDRVKGDRSKGSVFKVQLPKSL